MGHPGEQGDKGAPGIKGIDGAKGHPGVKGPIGELGERGGPGPSGPQGVKGARGRGGSSGFKGPTGQKGEDVSITNESSSMIECILFIIFYRETQVPLDQVVWEVPLVNQVAQEAGETPVAQEDLWVGLLRSVV